MFVLDKGTWRENLFMTFPKKFTPFHTFFLVFSDGKKKWTFLFNFEGYNELFIITHVFYHSKEKREKKKTKTKTSFHE